MCGKWDSMGLFASVFGGVQEDVDEVINEAVCPSCQGSRDVNNHVSGRGNGFGGRELDRDGCDELGWSFEVVRVHWRDQSPRRMRTRWEDWVTHQKLSKERCIGNPSKDDDGLGGGFGGVCDPSVGVRIVIFGDENFLSG
jgi:hypothetical protein